MLYRSLFIAMIVSCSSLTHAGWWPFDSSEKEGSSEMKTETKINDDGEKVTKTTKKSKTSSSDNPGKKSRYNNRHNNRQGNTTVKKTTTSNRY